MKKSSLIALFLTLLLNTIIAFLAVSGANGCSNFIFAPLKINAISNSEVQTLISSFVEHTVEHYHNFHSKNEEQNRRVEETEENRNLSLILSRSESVRILENIKIQRTRVAEALPEENCQANLFIDLSEQSAVSKNKSRHSETRRNIQQRK